MAQIPEKLYGELSPTQTPFDNIGLAFSGGGFRAASFCLGTMAYLNELEWAGGPMLQRVSYISSASGGTITNAMYALNEAMRLGFGDFYKKHFEATDGMHLLDRVMENLNNDDAWKVCPDKQRNLINAFALTYDQLLFDGKTAGTLKESAPGSHVDEVCFNTTEFYRGLLFRQAIKLKKDSKPDKTFLYGNFIIHLKDGKETGLKLADLLAASSCFPAGFEPILFPDDFAYDTVSKASILDGLVIEPQELKWSELKLLYNDAALEKLIARLPKPVDVAVLKDIVKKLPIRKEFKAGFMDGGITDNQGIESLMRANDRREKGDTDFKPFDLMLVNDVGSHYMDPYQPADVRPNTGLLGLSLKTVLAIAVILAVIGAGLIALAFVKNAWLYTAAAIAGTVLLLGFGGLAGALLYLRQFIRGTVRSGGGLNLDSNFSPEITTMLISHFGSTPLGVLVDMVKERFASILTLNNDVFLKRIRQLLYARFMDSGRNCFRIKTNHIYDLCYSNDLNRLNSDPLSPHPSKGMQIVAQVAFEMATTLWFSASEQKNHDQAAIIACGQFSTCYNLLTYIIKMKANSYFAKLSPEVQGKIGMLEEKLSVDFHRFCEDPFWLYNEVGLRYEVDDFKEQHIRSFAFPSAEFGGLRG